MILGLCRQEKSMDKYMEIRITSDKRVFYFVICKGVVWTTGLGLKNEYRMYTVLHASLSLNIGLFGIGTH